MDVATLVLAGNGLAIAVLAYLAVEVRRDVRETRDKALIMWDWFQNNVERRREETP